MTDTTGPPDGDASGPPDELDDPRVTRALEEYLAEREAGRRPDRREFLARHPAIAGPLAGCLDGLEFLAGSLGPGGDHNPPPPDPAPDRLGDYRLLREVGRGGMGVVYEAEQVSLGRRVALKVLPFTATLDPKQRQRFRNEAQAAAQLHHPHIVPVHAVGCERGVHYYAMQLIDGRTVAALIRERRRRAGEDADEPTTGHLSARPSAPADAAGPGDTATGPGPAAAAPAVPGGDWREVARLGIQAAEALDHAHQLGVVHRDVKPANLLVDARGDLWVTDFGLAQLQSSPGPTATGDLLGTLRYMSPEQALARRGVVDHRTDVYALGATLYELLTLRPALPGAERVELLHQIGYTEPVPPRRLNPALPVDLETIVLKALAKAPEERYATAQELADDLRGLLEDRPIRARRPTLSQRLRRWTRRHRSLAVSLAVSAGLLLAGGTAVAVGYALQERALSRQEQQAKRGAEGQLYRALLANAEGLRLARKPGYREQVFRDMHQAAALDVPEKDLGEIRSAVLACLGDPLGQDRVRGRLVTRVKRPPIPDAFADVIRQCPDREHALTAATPDGRLLGMIARCGRVMLFDRDGRRLADRDLPPLGAAYDLEMSRDGHFLAAGFEEGAAVWTTPDLVPHLFFRGGSVFSVALHRSGRLLATAGRQLELWSLTSNRLLTRFDPPAYGDRVEFSADGKYLLAVGGHGVAAWAVTETPEKRSLDGHAGGVPGLAFSPDGTRLASVSKDRTVRLWDAATGELRQTGAGPQSVLEAVTFSPDGSLLATGDWEGVIALWDGHTGAPLARTGRDPGLAQIWRLEFSATGRHLAAAGGTGVAVWERRAVGEAVALVRTFYRPLPGALDVAVHPSESQVVALTRDGNLFAYDFRQGTGPRRLAARARPEPRSLHFDAEGRRLLFVGPEGKLALWDWETDTLARQTDEPAVHLAVGPGGRWVATTTPSRATVVYDLEAGAETLALPEEAGDVWSLAWSPDGTRLAVGRSDGGVAVWDVEQVRDRLAEFGSTVPPTAAGSPAPRGGFPPPPP